MFQLFIIDIILLLATWGQKGTDRVVIGAQRLEPPGDLPQLRPRPLPMLANGLAGPEFHGAMVYGSDWYCVWYCV